MQPGYPGPGQYPNNPNPSDPFGQPGYGQMPDFPDPYQQQPPYPQEPQQPGPASGQPYPGPYGAPQFPPAGYPGGAYPGGGYTVPGPPPGVPSGQNNTLGLLGMVFGIASIPLAFCCNFLGLPVAVAGLVLGILGLRKANAGLANNRGMALAGIICGGVGVLLAIIFLVVGFAASSGSLWSHTS